MNFQSAHLQQALSGEYVLVVRDEGDVVALRLGEVLGSPVPVEEEGAVRRQPQLLRVRLLTVESSMMSGKCSTLWTPVL